MDVAGQRAAAATAQQPFFTDCKQKESNGSQMWARWAAASATSHLTEERRGGFKHSITAGQFRALAFVILKGHVTNLHPSNNN